MHLDPQYISLEMKSCGLIHRDAPEDYVSTVDIDILYGDDLEKIGEGVVYEVRMDHIINDGKWSLFTVVDGHSTDLYELYSEIFADDELIPAVEDEQCGFGNVVLIKSIVLNPEFRGQGLGGTLALAIAERFDERDVVALKPWPMNSDDVGNSGGVWNFPKLTKSQQTAIARKLRKSYQAAGFKSLFRGSKHLFLTHFRHQTVTQLIDKANLKGSAPDTGQLTDHQ